MADRIDHTGDAPEAMQSPSRQIGHVCYAAKWQQVMRTNTMDSDTADDDHIFLSIIETHTQRLGRINIVAVKQALLPEFPHTLRRAAGMCGVYLDTTGHEQATDRHFECGGIELADASNFGRRMVVDIACAIVLGVNHDITSPKESTTFFENACH
ncbi:hypothetical protein X979_2570 [Burkholderia pseudomallei MSHR7527]|nr:hypothetical protein X979_2570 [Burkholderia pseudomallei MSHR7527]KGW59172.1 hypothetical protein Y029_5944 [Burkholderia pseudomallei MSHR303]KGY02578.1 hypothetical protein Y023_427 [Burkholderia pseudomallei A79D]KGY03704.1 hypothetical protein X997_422 [Burkholderia pseudomallei A79C]